MTFKEYVHRMGLNMGEFKRLDKETQEIWRESHKKANIRQQKEAEEATYDVGEIKSDINYTVKIIDANGNVQKDASGNELSKDSKVTCNASFFKKLVAFFKGLFGSLPVVTIKP